VIDDARALAAKLERHRRELLRGRFHHDAGDSPISRVEDVVEALLEERAGLFGTALDKCHAARVQVPRHEAAQQFRDMRRDLRRLQHHTVARRNRTHERGEQQLDRVVPRSNDQDDAERLAEDAGAGGLLLKRGSNLLRAHPSGQLLFREQRLALHDGDVGDARFERRLAQIGLERSQEIFCVVVHHAHDLIELALAPQGRAGLTGIERGAQALHERRNRGDVGRRVGCRLDLRGHFDLLGWTDQSAESLPALGTASHRRPRRHKH